MKKGGQNAHPRPTYMRRMTSETRQLHAVFRRGIRGSDSILLDKKPQIAFVGRSNVGKSSTINAIVGERIARTSATPGKTQEINFFEVEGKGYIVDLPGYGYAKMSPEAAEKIRKHIVWYLTSGEARPALLVLVIDVRVGLTEHDEELVRIAKEEGHPLLLLANKIDKLSNSERALRVRAMGVEHPDLDIRYVSAEKREGTDEVRALVAEIFGIPKTQTTS